MPVVSKPSSFACRAERLARAGPGPDGLVVRPSREAQCERPSADSGEKVVLVVPAEFFWRDISDISFIDIAVCDMPFPDEFAQPGGCARVVFVVVTAHALLIRRRDFEHFCNDFLELFAVLREPCCDML